MRTNSPDADDAAPPSRMAVVFVVRGRFSNVQKTLDCLLSQTAVNRIDLMLTTDSAALLQEIERYVLSRGTLVNPRFLLHAAPDLASSRVFAATEATAEIMTITEDHSFPESNFVEELLGVFDSSAEILAAAPVMHNPNPGSAVSRAQFLLTHVMLRPVAHPPRTENCERLPWHNTTYRRAAFVAAAREVGLMQAEGLLQAEIRRNNPGARFVHCHHTGLWHVNMSRLAPAVEHAFHGGRIFGAERVKYCQWGWESRLPRVVLFPLVALLKMVRCAPILIDRRAPLQTLATLATSCLLTFGYAVGEAVGIACGKGNSATIYARYECNRVGLLDPAERHLLFSDSASPTLVDNTHP